MPIRIDNSTVSDRAWGDVDKATLARRLAEACVSNGVVYGYDDGYYRPDDVVTRDQMAVYISRAFELTL